MARTLFVTIDGTEFTRKTNRQYTHVVVATDEKGPRVYSWHGSQALAMKAAAQYRGRTYYRSTELVYKRSTFSVLPVTGERVTEPKAKKERTADQGPTPGQLNYLRMLAGLEHAPMASGNAASRLHSACVRLGWVQVVRRDDGFYSGSELTAAARELLGLSADIPEALAELQAAQELAARVRDALPAEAPSWVHEEARISWNRARNFIRGVQDAGRQYNSRNVAKMRETLADAREQLERSGVEVTPAAPVAEPTAGDQLQGPADVVGGDWVELKAGAPVHTARSGDISKARPGDVYEVMGKTKAGALVVARNQRRFIVARRDVAQVKVSREEIGQARALVEQLVDNLNAALPGAGFRLGYVGNYTQDGDDRGWRIFTAVQLPTGQYANFGCFHTYGLPALADAVQGKGADAERWARWVNHVAGVVTTVETAGA